MLLLGTTLASPAVHAASAVVHPIAKSPWVYAYIRCGIYEGAFTNEAEAVDVGMVAIYGACATVKNASPWGGNGACGSTHYHPSFPWDYSSNVEIYNNRQYTIYPNCGSTATDGMTVRRVRTAGCPSGYTSGAGSLCYLTGTNPLKNAGQGCPVTGNPVNSATGNKVQREDDYFSDSVTPLEFTRYYNSNAGFPGVSIPILIGENWTSTYSRYIQKTVNYGKTIATVLRPDGKALFYARDDATNEYLSDDDIKATLEELTDGSGNPAGWRYTDADNSIELYDVNGVLQSIADLQGNTTSLVYDSLGRLERVDSNTGQYITTTSGITIRV